MQKLSLIGNIGNDATLNEVNGKQVINFNLATAEKQKNGEFLTTWFNCSKWTEKGAEKLLPYLKKGSKLFIEGDLGLSTYQDKTQINCRITNLVILTPKNS